MMCPRCQAVPLSPTGWDDFAAMGPYRSQVAATLERLQCSKCGGSWVPLHSVPQLVSKIATAMVGEQQAQAVVLRFERDSELMDVADALQVACPRCTEPMEKLRSRVRFLVLYDRCGKCGGMWFDDDELARIVSALQTRI